MTEWLMLKGTSASSGPTALPKPGQQGQVIQDHVHTAFDYLQGWRLCNLYLSSSVTKYHPFVPTLKGEELPISSCLSEKKGHTNMRSKKMLTFLGFALLTPQSLVIYKNLHKDFIKWFFTPKETLLFLWKWIINPQKFLKLKPVAICYWGSDGFFSVTNCLLRYYIFTYPVAFIWEI